MEISASEPSDDTMLAYLRAEQTHYYFDDRKYGDKLKDVTLIAVSGPTAAGKSTLVRNAARFHTIAELQSSMTRAMAERDAHEPHHRFSVPLKEFYNAATDHSIVNYFVNKNDHVYGTFTDGFTAPLTIGAIGTDTIFQLMSAELHDVQVAYTLLSQEDYAERLGLDRINQPDILPRIQEGFESLKFAEDHLDARWLSPILLSNEPGELERAADDVSRIAYQRTLSTLNAHEALNYINGMREVLTRAIGRIALQ